MDTKVNRLLTEGRRAFLRRVSGIERGAECARYEPLLSALADGEATAQDLARLRPHMQTCLTCRAALREFRAMPERRPSPLPSRRHRLPIPISEFDPAAAAASQPASPPPQQQAGTSFAPAGPGGGGPAAGSAEFGP